MNQTECVRLLLEHGADVNLGRVETAETPLHHALSNDAGAELIGLLIQHGADVNAKTKPGLYSYNFNGNTPTRGETPLHRAAAYASLEIVKLLLEAGADRTAVDVNGNTPHEWAGWHRRAAELVNLLAP
ncbi:MAG: ankyrin repeat domain-containing protein [Lacipirellulaceae bacterium]